MSRIKRLRINFEEATFIDISLRLIEKNILEASEERGDCFVTVKIPYTIARVALFRVRNEMKECERLNAISDLDISKRKFMDLGKIIEDEIRDKGFKVSCDFQPDLLTFDIRWGW